MSTDMSTERWERTKQILQEALQRAPEHRPAFLHSACGEDAALRSEVQSLIDSHEEAGSNFLADPAPEILEVAAKDFSGSLANRTMGNYRLVEEIGRGGMGQVWLAEQTAPVRRQVALKLIKVGMYDDDILKRFQLERQSLAIMDHPSIAKVFDAGATPDGQPYFVMEYVRGVPITDYCDQKKLKIRERLELFIKVCEGVQHAHQKAVIHRDLKPANILVQEVDDKPVPRIIDFGLAKATGPQMAGESLYTSVRAFMGTPGYMSPEQCDRAGVDIDTRTDVYSLGIVLYVLLTGCLPFQAKPGKEQSIDEMLRRVREQDPPRPSTKVSTDRRSSSVTAEARGTQPGELVSLLRGDLDWITMKALEKDRARRYGSPAELAADLMRHLNYEPVVAGPVSIGYRTAKFVRRHRFGFVAATLVLAAIIGGSGVAIYQGRIAQRRFQDVRKLAHTFVFDLHDEIAKLEGSTKAREMMVRTALEYLDDLARSAGSDLDLQREIAAAYVKIGDAEGYPTKPNLGRVADALRSYQKAGDIYRRIAAKNPAYLPDLARYYMNYAGLIRFTHRFKEARQLSESAIQVFDGIQSRQGLDGDLEASYTQAWCTLGDLDEDLDNYHQAWKEFSKCGELAHARLNKVKDEKALSALSQADERIGTAAQELGLLAQSIRALDEDESILKELLAAQPQNPVFHRRQALVHHYKSQVYYYDMGPNYGDPARALESARRYLDAATEMVRSDSSNTSAKFSRAVAMYSVTLPLREFDPNAAVTMARDSVHMFDEMVAAGKPTYLIASRRVRALRRLGEAQLKAGRVADARATAQAALNAERPIAAGNDADGADEHSVLVQLLILAGEAGAASGDFKLAESQLQQARVEAQQIAERKELTTLAPLANAEQALGTFYAKRGRIEEARTCYIRLNELWQGFPETNEYVELQKAASQRLLASLH